VINTLSFERRLLAVFKSKEELEEYQMLKELEETGNDILPWFWVKAPKKHTAVVPKKQSLGVYWLDCVVYDKDHRVIGYRFHNIDQGPNNVPAKK
jgi:hypothetical protein